jgi:disulfide bond formation protein DsbB
MAGLFISIYHFGIENQLWRNLSSCSDQLLGKNINTNNLLVNLDEIEPNCSDPVKIFGLSISTYNVASNFLMLLFVIYSFFIIKNKKN